MLLFEFVISRKFITSSERHIDLPLDEATTIEDATVQQRCSAFCAKLLSVYASLSVARTCN